MEIECELDFGLKKFNIPLKFNFDKNTSLNVFASASESSPYKNKLLINSTLDFKSENDIENLTKHIISKLNDYITYFNNASIIQYHIYSHTSLLNPKLKTITSALTLLWNIEQDIEKNIQPVIPFFHLNEKKFILHNKYRSLYETNDAIARFNILYNLLEEVYISIYNYDPKSSKLRRDIDIWLKDDTTLKYPLMLSGKDGAQPVHLFTYLRDVINHYKADVADRYDFWENIRNQCLEVNNQFQAFIKTNINRILS